MISHLRVFISSTMDLKSERDAVTDVINQLEQIPVRMEFFTARSQSPEEVCLEEVSKCDLYVGIFGKKYGFVPGEDNPRQISATALEFEKARELKIPTFVFIQKDPAERDSELASFLDQISSFKRGVFRKTFGSIDELKYWVLASIVFHLSNRTDDVEQKVKFEKLVPFESLFRHYVEKMCEYVDLKGIYQLRRIVQLKLENMYVPLKLKPVSILKDQPLEFTLEEIEDASGVELAVGVPFPLTVRGFIGEITHLGVGPKGTSEFSDEKELPDIILRNRNIVILGPPGSGKTTMLRHLSRNLVMDKELGLIPILVPLREYARYLKDESDTSILHYLEHYFRSHCLEIPDKFIARQLSSGGCIVMLDGLDEILSEKDRITAASNIEEFAASFGKDNIIIVSSRVSAYRPVQISYFNHFMIQKLTLSQIREFISKWFQMVEEREQSDEYKRLIHQLTSDVGLLSLSANPLMLSLICLAGLQGIPIPRKKADLYDMCVKTLLSSWEVKKGLPSKLSEPQRFDILKSIAYNFVEKRWITATEYEILSFIEKKLENASLTDSQRKDLAIVLLKHLIERSGLFVEREPNIYGFVHLGLRDYLAALYLAGIDNVKDMFSSFLLSKLHNSNFEYIIVLCARCLANQSPDRASILMKSIMNAKTSQEEYVHLDLTLASKCLFESGILYGELATEILHKIANVLENGNEIERKFIMSVFEEIDYELYDDFLCSLISDLDPKVSVDLIDRLSFTGMIPEKCEFCDLALNLLRREALSDTESSRDASMAISVWAARGSQKALSQAFEIIRKGGKAAITCTWAVIPLAREDLNVRKELLKIIDEETSSRLKGYLLQTLLQVAPDEVKEKASKIADNEKEDPELRKIAATIYNYTKLTEAEANELRSKIAIEITEPMLQGRPPEVDPSVLLVLGWVLTQDLAKKILAKLPETFKTNRELAFRFIQMLDDYIETSPSFGEEIKTFTKQLDQSGDPMKRKLFLYMSAEIDSLQLTENKTLLVELAEDKEEFVVARRAALNRLSHIPGWEEYSSRLLKLSTDREVNENLFSLLLESKLDRNELLRAILGQITQGDTALIYYLRMLIQQSFD